MPSKVFLSPVMKSERNCASVGGCPSVRHNMPHTAYTQVERMMQVDVVFLQFKAALVSSNFNFVFVLWIFWIVRDIFSDTTGLTLTLSEAKQGATLYSAWHMQNGTVLQKNVSCYFPILSRVRKTFTRSRKLERFTMFLQTRSLQSLEW